MFEELPSAKFSNTNLYIIAKKYIVSPFCHDIVLQFLYQRFYRGRGGLREYISPAYLVHRGFLQIWYKSDVLGGNVVSPLDV